MFSGRRRAVTGEHGSLPRGAGVSAMRLWGEAATRGGCVRRMPCEISSPAHGILACGPRLPADAATGAFAAVWPDSTLSGGNGDGWWGQPG